MWRQLSCGVGLVGLLVVVSVDYRNPVRFAPVFYVIGLGLLLSVFILGRTVSGARRWIHLGPLTVQPSELFKLIFIITLAWALTSARGERLSRASLVGTFVLLGVPFFLVVRQPDLGTALVLVPVLAATLVGLGLRMKVLGGLALASVALMPLAWFVLKPYQRDRLLVYLDRSAIRSERPIPSFRRRSPLVRASSWGRASAARRRAAWLFFPSGTLISFLPCSRRCGGFWVVSC
jgi:cell division protein FtsW (lipid II flippase)